MIKENQTSTSNVHKVHSWIIWNMSNGSRYDYHGTEQNAINAASIYAKQFPNSDMWLYKKIGTVKADLPVSVKLEN